MAKQERILPIPRLIDEIDRMFEEMVRHPWGRPTPAASGARRPPETSHLEIELPIAAGRHGDVSVSVQGRQLIVTVQQQHGGPPGTTAAHGQERLQRAFALPDDSDIGSIEARFEDHLLRIRIGLRPKR
jgi:HSP20 family molecular chaperone IbpA